MQTIETRHFCATAFRGSRIKAVTTSGRWLWKEYSFDDNDEAAHRAAAYALRDLMGWTGEMIGGHTKRGMVWVFMPEGDEK